MNLFELLDKVNGASFIGITTVTDVELNKFTAGRGSAPNPHHGRVVKITEGTSVMVFTNKNTNAYEAMVKRRLEAEGKDAGSFTVGPRVWGTRLEGLPVVEHKGKYYLEVIHLKPGRTRYLMDGKEIKRDQIIGMRKESVSEEGQGGLDNKVVIRTYAFDSISSITIGGDTYKLF